MESQQIASSRFPLKVAIADSPLTQRVIAERAEIDETRLSKIIHGRVPAKPEEKRAIARILRHPMRVLFPIQGATV